MKRALISIAFCMAHINSAFSQIHQGTIEVVYFTNEKIIMAADSRQMSSGHRRIIPYPGSDRRLPHDDECKIVALDSQLVSTVAGITSIEDRWPLVPEWKSSAEIRRIYADVFHAYGTSNGHVEEITTKWEQVIAAHLQRSYVFLPDTIIAAANKFNGLLTQALVGGRDNSGNLLLLFFKISLDRNNALGIDASPVWPVIDCPIMHFWCAIGETAVVDEFLTDTPKSEAFMQPTLSDVARTERLVELTIANNPVRVAGGFFGTVISDVGGPVDSVELDKSIGLHWWHRKKNCP